MEKVIEKTKVKKLNLSKWLLFFIMTCLLSYIKLFDTSLWLTLPLLMMSFISGIGYLLVCLCLLFIPFYLGLMSSYEAITILISLFMMILSLKIPKMKTEYLPYLITFLFSIGLILLQRFTLASLFLVIITLIHCNASKHVAILFSSHEEESLYTKSNLVILLCGMLVCCIHLNTIHPLMMMTLIHILILIGLYYIGVKEAFIGACYISMIMMLVNPSLKEEMIGLLLPLSFFLLYVPKTKIGFSSLYILAHILCPLFTSIPLIHLALEMFISGIVFLLMPSFSNQETIMDDSFQEVTINSKMITQIHSFSNLFKQLTLLFGQEKKPVDTLEFSGEMYEEVCASCTSCKQCYQSGQGPNRLVKLIQKGIKEELDSEDNNFIRLYCLKEREYKQKLMQLKREFKRVHRVNKEYSSLKKDLYHQFALLANVLDHFSLTLETGQLSDAQLKETLLGYQYEIIFLKKEIISTYEYDLKIGMVSIGRKNLEQEFIPLVEKLLHTSLTLSSYKETMPKLGYAYIVLHHKPSYHIHYGVGKYSKDPKYCGDSHTFFRFQEKEYIAISDGMGYGKEAHEESTLTLNVLHQLLVNGVSLAETIHSINALLKIKNRMDMYTTLDLCEIDLTKGRAQFVKNGAIQSYIIRNHKVRRIEGTSLPMGIVASLEEHQDIVDLEDQDLIIMGSDGITGYCEDFIKEDSHMYASLTPQEITDRLLSQIHPHLHDDVTLIVFRFHKE